MEDEKTKAFFCTGVRATADEIKTMQQTYALPIMMIGGRTPEPEMTVHRFALKHGLPEITGHYGCDFRDGEFIRLKDDEPIGPLLSNEPTVPAHAECGRADAVATAADDCATRRRWFCARCRNAFGEAGSMPSNEPTCPRCVGGLCPEHQPVGPENMTGIPSNEPAKEG